MLKLPKRLHPEFKRPNIKPEGPFVLDTNNPIVDRLQHCFVVDGNSIVDLVTGRRIKTSSYTKTKHSIFGGELQVTTDDQYLADYFDIDRFDGNGDFSVVFRATTRNQGAVADISTVLELGAKTGTAKGYLRIQQHTRDAGSGVPGSYYFATYANYGTTACYVSGPGAPDYKRWDNAAFVRDGNNLIGYTDGAERYNEYSVSKRNIFYGGGGRIKLLQGQSTFQPSFSYLYVFTRALSPAEVKSLNDDPYQILKPANDLYYFSPVGGGGPTTHECAAAFSQSFGISTSKTADYSASASFSQSFGMSQGGAADYNTETAFSQSFDAIAANIATIVAQAQTGITSSMVAANTAIINAGATIHTTHSVISAGGLSLQAAAEFAVTHALATDSDISIEALADFAMTCGLLCSVVNNTSASADFGMISGAVAETVAILNAQAQMGISSGLSVTRTFVTDAGITCSITSSYTASGAIQVVGSVTTPGSRTLTILADSRTLTITLENRTLTIEE